MDWFLLFISGLLEIVWVTGLKYTEGFTKLYPTLFTLFFMACSFPLLSYAMKTIPIGTAYAVWTGIGAVGVALLGILYFGESTDIVRVISILLVASGIVGLKLAHK